MAQTSWGPALGWLMLAGISVLATAYGIWIQLTRPDIKGFPVEFTAAVVVLFAVLVIYSLIRFNQLRPRS